MAAAKYERRTLEDIRRMLAEHPADAGGRSPDIHSARRADIAALRRVEALFAAEFDGMTQERADAIAAAAPTQGAAMVAIAQAGDGTVNASVAARAIRRAGLTTSGQVSLTASLWNRLNLSRQWEYADSGNFRYIAPAPTLEVECSLLRGDTMMATDGQRHWHVRRRVALRCSGGPDTHAWLPDLGCPAQKRTRDGRTVSWHSRIPMPPMYALIQPDEEANSESE